MTGKKPQNKPVKYSVQLNHLAPFKIKQHTHTALAACETKWSPWLIQKENWFQLRILYIWRKDWIQYSWIWICCPKRYYVVNRYTDATPSCRYFGDSQLKICSMHECRQQQYYKWEILTFNILRCGFVALHDMKYDSAYSQAHTGTHMNKYTIRSYTLVPILMLMILFRSKIHLILKIQLPGKWYQYVKLFFSNSSLGILVAPGSIWRHGWKHRSVESVVVSKLGFLLADVSLPH